MADVASKKTDKEILKLNKKLEEVYKEAQSDIQGKLDDFVERFKDKHKVYQEKLKKGEIKKEDYDAWLKGQVFQRKQWEGKLNDITNTLHNTNQIALAMVNGKMSGIFAYNANYEAYKLEHGAGINFGFGIYDQTTVSRLIKDDPQTLPKWKIEEPKEYVWNKKKVNNAITQGVIQGQKLDEITDSIAAGLCSQNENLMKTFARTGMTEAQNAGRFSRLMEAKAKGITVVKQWMATLDGRTRDTHADIDGETQPVGDKWHPYKFSNGCRYPGDPQAPAREVYNCRCTLVGDVADYPAEYQRYDNVDGKPIKNMTYKEWYEAKYGKKFEPKKIAPPAPKKKPAPATIDYSKYGGKEFFDLIQKYDYDWSKFVTESELDEFAHAWNVAGDSTTVKAWFKKASDDKTILENAKANAPKKITVPKLTEEEKQQKAYEDAKKKLASIEEEIKNKGADKKFTGIWKDQNITYADYESKKHTIEAKKQYYEYQIAEAKKDFNEIFANDEEATALWNAFTDYTTGTYDPAKGAKIGELLKKYGYDSNDMSDMYSVYMMSKSKIGNIDKYLNDLNEFEKHGEEYSKLLAERESARQSVKNLQPKLSAGQIFADEAYSQERKDAALWNKSKKETDKILRPATGESWRDASKAEKQAAYDYTVGSGKFNRPLRGYEDTWNPYSNKGVGNVPLNQEGAAQRIHDLTDLIERTPLQQDTWLQRGVSFDGSSGFLGLSEHDLSTASEKDLQDALVGLVASDPAFLSCGSTKGTGFDQGCIFNIYCPKGTQAIYCEPFSHFSADGDLDWDGVSEAQYFGNEFETLLQRNTYFRITKIEKGNNVLYIDMEVVDQKPHEINYVD